LHRASVKVARDEYEISSKEVPRNIVVPSSEERLNETVRRRFELAVEYATREFAPTTRRILIAPSLHVTMSYGL
jgi:hypothetical protein